MTPWARAMLGAGLGGLVVLTIHPFTRSFYQPWRQVGPSPTLTRSPWLSENIQKAPAPNDLKTGAYWMLLGCLQIGAGKQPTEATLDDLIRVAAVNRSIDPENAFWPQMESLFLLEARQREESWQAWERASRCTRWDDYQWERLLNLRAGLVQESGGEQAWQMSLLHTKRSLIFHQRLLNHAGKLLITSPLDTPTGLRQRLVMIQNGILMRDGARSVYANTLGQKVIELSTREAGAAPNPTQRKLLTARLDFLQRLRDNQLEGYATGVSKAFDDNTSWAAILSPQEADESLDERSKWALAYSTLPAGFTIATLIGLLLWAKGFLIDRWARVRKLFHPKRAVWMGVLWAALVYPLTQSLWAALVGLMVFAFFLVEPRAYRSAKPQELGSLYRLTLVFVGSVMFMSIVLAWAGISRQAEALAPVLGVQPEFLGARGQFVGMVFIAFALLLLVAPVWTLIMRFPAAKLVSITLRQFGTAFALIGAWLAILVGIFCAVQDQALNQTSLQAAQDESLYFYRN